MISLKKSDVIQLVAVVKSLLKSQMIKNIKTSSVEHGGMSTVFYMVEQFDSMGGTSPLFPWYGIIRWHPPTRGYQLTFIYVGVFGVPAHFLIYGKDTGFLFVIGCSR